jgi:hypothetical protein
MTMWRKSEPQGFEMGPKVVQDFNPMKFDFAPTTMRNFNPLKFEFDMQVAPQESERDLLQMLPECLGPENQLFLPQMGITSHRDVTLNEHDNVTPGGYFQRQAPASTLDSDTLNLLDSLELKFAPSSATISPQPSSRRTTVDMSQVVDDVLNEPQHVREVSSVLEDKSNFGDVGNTQGLSPEQIRVMRNKAVQKRYRIRKKNESQRQMSTFVNTQQSLMAVECRAPQHHIEVVDKLLRLRKMNKDRDSEIKRLRKMLASEKTSKDVTESEVVVMESGMAQDGDFCDENMDVYLPRDVVLDTYANACCEKMVGDMRSYPMVAKALAASSRTMSSLLER